MAEEKMVNATIELLNNVGLAGTTLNAIGETAGYSRGLATHHFGSKSGLFRKVLRHITAVWTEELESNLESKDGLDAILAALDAHRDHLLRGDGVALAVAQFLDHAAGDRRHFEYDLVGLQVDQRFVACHAIAHLLVPGGDGDL